MTQNHDGIACIGFFATVDAKSFEELADILTNQLPKGMKTVHLLMCTGGGSVSHGIAAYNLLKAMPYRIVTHNIGNVDSIGVTMFLAGEERYACSNATFLLHQVKSTIAEEKMEASVAREKLSGIEADEKRIKKIIKEKTALPTEEIDRLFTTGDVKDADYALQNGLIHAVKEMSLTADRPILIVKAGK